MSLMEAFGYPSAGTAKSKLLAAVREAGAVRLEAEYSGGNDEGGVNNIVLKGANGETLPTPDDTITRPAKPGDNEWQVREGVVREYHPLWEAANDMLSTEFYTWAGEFSAWGTLYADLKENRVWREGEMQSGYDSDSAEY